MLFESTRLASGKVIKKQKLQYPVRILEFLVGAGGFEQPRLCSAQTFGFQKARNHADFQTPKMEYETFSARTQR